MAPFSGDSTKLFHFLPDTNEVFPFLPDTTNEGQVLSSVLVSAIGPLFFGNHVRVRPNTEPDFVYEGNVSALFFHEGEFTLENVVIRRILRIGQTFSLQTVSTTPNMRFAEKNVETVWKLQRDVPPVKIFAQANSTEVEQAHSDFDID